MFIASDLYLDRPWSYHFHVTFLFISITGPTDSCLHCRSDSSNLSSLLLLLLPFALLSLLLNLHLRFFQLSDKSYLIIQSLKGLPFSLFVKVVFSFEKHWCFTFRQTVCSTFVCVCPLEAEIWKRWDHHWELTTILFCGLSSLFFSFW